MNAFRTISRVFVIAAVVAVANVCAMDGMVGRIDANKATIAAIMFETALPENADAAKAAVDTIGVAVDQSMAGKSLNTTALTANLVANLGARKVVRCLAANGYKLPNPDLGVAGNHVGHPLRDIVVAAAPQLIAGLAVMALVK